MPDDSAPYSSNASPRVNEVDVKQMDEMREKAGIRLSDVGVTGVTKEAVAGIVCSLIEEHLNALHIEQTTNWTLLLPDDMLMEIFSTLTTREREPLGLTCKRFRDVDLELGKRKFDKIKVCGRFGKISITGVTPATGKNKKIGKEYTFIWPPEEFTLIPSSDHILDFFKKSKTELLNINVAYAHDLPAKFDMLSNVLRTVTFKKVIVYFKNVEDSSESFICDLLVDRNLENVKVSLTWISRIESVHSMQFTRKFLQQLPKINNLKVHWVGQFAGQTDLDHPSDRLVDDASLLHIVSRINYAVLCMSDCTVPGILKAFAVVSQSENKYASFIVPRATFDKLSAMQSETLHKKYVKDNDLHFIDRERKYAMVALPYKKHAYVSMGRMGDDEQIIDKWPKSWDEDYKFD